MTDDILKIDGRVLQFIDLICPEHSRTSCSDEDWNNYLVYDKSWCKFPEHRCSRCALLQLARDNIEFEGFKYGTILLVEKFKNDFRII